MSYTLSIPLKIKASKDYLVEAFQFPYTEYTDFIKISCNIAEHDYPKKIKNGIFCSYKVMRQDAAYYLRFFASKVAIKNGLKKICKVNKKSYPYYYYDWKIVYIIPKNDVYDFNEYLMYENFDIHVNEEIEDINIHSHIKKSIMDVKEKEFNDLFGNNELLKNNCNKLQMRLSK